MTQTVLKHKRESKYHLNIPFPPVVKVREL